MKSILAAILIVSTLLVTTEARTDGKITVAVTHTGEDVIGERLAFRVREAIRTSAGYELVSGPSALLRIRLVTLDPDKSRSNSGNWTVASYVITMRNLNPFDKGKPQTWYSIYMTSGVVTSGGSRVDETAVDVVASLDSAIEQFRSDERRTD